MNAANNGAVGSMPQFHLPKTKVCRLLAIVAAAALGRGVLADEGVLDFLEVDDLGGDDTDENGPDGQEEGGTPIYDLAHHRWGTAETYTSTFLLVFIGLFGVSIVGSFYISHVAKCTLVRRWHAALLRPAERLGSRCDW